jgi:hypothetical protein
MSTKYYTAQEYLAAREDFAKLLERLAVEVRAGKWDEWDFDATHDPDPIYRSERLAGFAEGLRRTVITLKAGPR